MIISRNGPLNPGLFVNGWLHVALILIKHRLNGGTLLEVTQTGINKFPVSVFYTGR